MTYEQFLAVDFLYMVNINNLPALDLIYLPIDFFLGFSQYSLHQNEADKDLSRVLMVALDFTIQRM
jgi:hypothetical protein